MNSRLFWTGCAMLTAGIWSMATAASPGAPNSHNENENMRNAEYWVKFPHPARVFVTEDANAFPPLFEGDQQGMFGSLSFTLQSLAGLAARTVANGTDDAMVWVDMVGNHSMQWWLADVLKHTGAERIDAPDPEALIRQFIDAGHVDGYITYAADQSDRRAYTDVEEEMPGYTASVNVATSIAPFYNALIIDKRAEAFLQDLGLERLMDVSDQDERWAFESYRDRFSDRLVHIIDPKVPHMRDYAMATESVVVYGVTDLTDEVYHWLPPNRPVVGWNDRDEYVQTSQMSRAATFSTATNWLINVPILSAVRADEDIPADQLRLDRDQPLDPLALDWPEGTHYTAYVMSDGDNVQWLVGNFAAHQYYWQSPVRGDFPFGWTIPTWSLYQIAPSVLHHVARTMTPVENVFSHGAGYYYPDEYARDVPNRAEVLDARAHQVGEAFKRTGMRVLNLILYDWDCDEAIEAYEAYAHHLPGLTGILAVQYAPYNAGLGDIIWVENADGAPIPVVSARYAIWAGLSHLDKKGPPALVAQYINEQPSEPHALGMGNFDWTVVHAWSRFVPADTSDDMLAEEKVDLDDPAAVRASRVGLEPVAWSVNRLDDHVKVIRPDELMWRIRLAQRPRETLDSLARDLYGDPETASFQRELLNAYRAWLAEANFGEDGIAQKALDELRRIRFAMTTEPIDTE